MQIVETMFEARAPGECSVTRAVLEDLIAATDTWVGREIFVVHRLKGLNKLTHTRCFAEEGAKPPMSVVVNETDAGITEHPELREIEETFWVHRYGDILGPFKRFDEAVAKMEDLRCQMTRKTVWGRDGAIDSASWTGRAGDVPEKPKEQAKPNPVPTPADMRDDLIRRLTDCARDLDTLKFNGWAEDVRYVRNCVKRGDDKAAPPESPLDRAWEHLRQADRDLVHAKQPVLAKLAVLLRDDVGELLSRKPAPANCTELDRADKMGGALQSDFGVGRGPQPETTWGYSLGGEVVRGLSEQQAKTLDRAFEKAVQKKAAEKMDLWRSTNFGDLRKAERETGRQEGLREAIRDIENYPTAFAMAMKRNLVDLIQERVRGER